MTTQRSRLVLRTALCSALLAAALSVSAVSLPTRAADVVSPADTPAVTVSESDAAPIIVPFDEGADPIADEPVSEQVGNELEDVVPKVVKRRMLASTVYFATNYEDSFGGEVDSELAAEFYNVLKDKFVTNRSGDASFAYAPVHINGTVDVNDPDEAAQGFNGATVTARQQAIAEVVPRGTDERVHHSHGKALRRRPQRRQRADDL